MKLGELIIVANKALIKAICFKLITDVKQRWNAESLKHIRGSPWKPTPEVEDVEIHVEVRMPNDSGPITAPIIGADFEPAVRRVRITPPIVQTLGLLLNCNGCRAIRDKEPISKNHSE